MPELRRRHAESFAVRPDQPLIGILEQEGDHEIVRYFTNDDQADEASDTNGVQRALKLAGAWKDLDWLEAEQELDRIRHESTPTPPIDLDL